MKINESTSWKKLEQHYTDLKEKELKDLINDEKRFNALSLQFDQLFCDFSKQKVTEDTVQLLLELAKEVRLPDSISALMQGEVVNTTENRAALHTALRMPQSASLIVNSEDIVCEVHNSLNSMADLVHKLTNGVWRGFNGKAITDVVNLGVGGSDLGPMLICDALDEFATMPNNPINVHFASTMDGSQVHDLVEFLNPETTLFVVVSKSFSTIDTLSNAATAKAWLMQACKDEGLISKLHFIGISANPKKMSEWGIALEHQLKFWDWVGGRFSLWSTVGLTIALKIGMEGFRQMLAGAHSLDEHFRTSPLKNNIPVLLGLIGVWNTNFMRIPAHAILPYDARLKYFPSYLTQLEMESNGKSVSVEGEMLDIETCPVLWGEIGPNAQHAFYQLLHQGTRKVVCDFIAPIKRFEDQSSELEKSLHDQHMLTLANCFAQSRALMLGSRTIDSSKNIDRSDILSNHKYYPGNQPSTTILFNRLTPYSLGQLIALYEHKVFVMAHIWGTNPFDQWGVELGKIMAVDTLTEMQKNEYTNKFDVSTNKLINFVKSNC